MARDMVLACVLLLKGDADLAALVSRSVEGITGQSIYGEELPASEAEIQPRAAVVVKQVSGAEGIGGYVNLDQQAIEVWCYGETPQAAETVRQAVYTALKYARRQVVQGTLLHSFDQISAPRFLRDPDTGWPASVSIWRALASEEQAV